MHLRLLALLLVVPLVLAGDFERYWKEIEDDLKEKFNKDKDVDKGEKKDDNNDQKGWGDDKGWGDKKGLGDDKGWGDKKGWGDDKDKGKDKGWGVDKSRGEDKGWGDDKGWGEDKGWGDKKGWGDDEGWGDQQDRGDRRRRGEHRRRSDSRDDDEQGNGNSEEDDDDNDKNGSKLAEFKEWLRQRYQRRKQSQYKDFLSENFEQFRDFVRFKALKEQEERDAKEAIQKQMEKVRMMETLKGRLQNVSDEYVEQKTKFMFSITGHFLDFCKCDNSRDLLDRIWSGDFAEKDGEMSPTSNDPPSWNNTGAPGNMWGSNDTMPQQRNTTESWPATTEAPARTTASEEDDFMEKVKRFASLDRKELVSQVLQDLVKIMCESASQYFLSINTLEDAILQYRNSHP